MCNYNGIKVTRDQFINLLEQERILKQFQLNMRSGFDWSDWPIIKPILHGQWDFEMAHWEFIAPWIKTAEALKESRKKFTTLNATSERLFESKMFKDAAIKRRCLVLSTGFYEWRHYKPEGEKKPLTYPYHITVDSPEQENLFFMAGIYQPWVDTETGEIKDSFAIVTTVANSLMEQVHNVKKRMPTILPKELAEEWISEGLPEQRISEIAAYQFPSDKMKAWTIRKDFRVSDDPREEYHYDELPELV